MICWVAVLILSLAFVPIRATGYEYTADEVDDLIGGILAYKLEECGADNVQEWIDGYLTEKAGIMSEWYIIALSQNGERNMDSYEQALISYINSKKINSATMREKFALSLCAAGSSNSYISDILDDSIGANGIMSRIYGLHVLNNGYTCKNYTISSIIDELLDLQYSDGGWALFGEYGDIDVTAMTIQALAPYYNDRSDVHTSIDHGLSMLSERQMDDGGYQSFGTPNPESSAQVLTALSALGIDCQEDSRFIKSGKSIIDSMVTYRLSDGGYCHVAGGDFNETATIQAMYSFVAYKRLLDGKPSLYLIDNRQKQDQSCVSPAITTGQTTTQTKEHSETSSFYDISSSLKLSTTVTSTTTAVVGSTSLSLTNYDIESHISSSVKLPITVTSSSTSSVGEVSVNNNSSKRGGYKPVVILIIIGAGALLSLLLLVLGKRSYKNFVFVGLAVAAGGVIILVTDIRSADDYYGSTEIKTNTVGTVTMEIRCDTVIGKSDKDYIPEDGIILPVTVFDIEDGDTVYDVLTDAAQTYGIQIDARGGSKSMIYVAGINYLYEFDFGDLSGWVYHVNGISPSRNSGDYILSDGDVIEWLYTCELGHDLNEVYEE